MHHSASSPPGPWFAVVFPFFFAAIWLLVGFISSRQGWRSFANRYGHPTRPAGTAYSSPQSLFGALARYNGVVRVIFTDAGLYCYVMILFRAFHPPFLLPWPSVKRVEKKDSFFGSYYWLEIEDPAGNFRMRLPAKIEPDLKRYQKTG